jgi:hypothetical protein
MAYKPWNIASILSSTRRLPLTELDRQALVSYIKVSTWNGIDIHLHPLMTKEVQRYFASGLVVLRSDELDQDFLFLKLDASRSASAEWKSPFLCLLGSVQEDTFTPGPTYSSFIAGLTALNDIFRTAGLVKGPAI